MKIAAIALAASVSLALSFDAQAATKSENCAAYARNATAATPTTTGAARGAARGAVLGGISGNGGAGAATGAVVGGVRRSAQKHRSYQYYYDECMRR